MAIFALYGRGGRSCGTKVKLLLHYKENDAPIPDSFDQLTLILLLLPGSGVLLVFCLLYLCALAGRDFGIAFSIWKRCSSVGNPRNCLP